MLVTGLGQCCLDYLALIEGFPEIDTKQEVLEWKEQGGGPVATALVALSRLGVRCRFYGIAGDDHAGEKVVRSLTEEGIDTSGLVKRSGFTSQVAFITIERKTGKRTIFWKRPTGEELTEEELGEDFLRGSSFLLIDGLMATVSLAAAKRARVVGVPVMLDAGRIREGMLEIAALCDYVVASEECAKDLGWQGSPTSFQGRAGGLGAKVVTITLGDRGSISYAGDRIIEVPAFKVDVADTTGAGDVFHGGYVYGLLAGWGIERTLLFASATAAMKCREIGGRKGIPSLPEVRAFLKERGFDYSS
jgi:ribokinase